MVMRNIGLSCLAILFLVGCEGDEDESRQLVYIDDQAIQCEFEGVPRVQTAQPLIDHGIDVVTSHCGVLTGISTITVCGVGTTGIHLHEIHIENTLDAEALGFESVDELDNSDEELGYMITECDNEK